VTNQPMQIRLPDLVTLNLASQEIVTILGALAEYGPYKVILPLVRTIEQQMMAQQLKPEYKGPPLSPSQLPDSEEEFPLISDGSPLHHPV